MKEIGVGVIGTMFMGRAHSIAYNASASVFGTGLRPRLEVICDQSLQRASRCAADLGFNRHTDKWQEVVADSEVELISICTPNDTHADMAIAALKAGKHVWCEKPMSASLADSRAMAKAALDSCGKTIIGYNYTKNPAVAHARQLIESGAIGRAAAFFCRYDVDNEADGERPWSWRMSREKSGTGAIGDVLSHVISIAHFVTGSTISRVAGDVSIVHPERNLPDAPGERKKVDNDDMVAALVKFENGIHGHVGASRVSWGMKCGLRWEVHGTEGTICFNQERLNELRIFTRQDNPATDGFRTVLTGPLHEPYSAFLPNAGHGLGFMDVKVCELHELLCAIEKDTSAWPDFSDGLVIEKVLDAVDRSSISGNWESV